MTQRYWKKHPGKCRLLRDLGTVFPSGCILKWLSTLKSVHAFRAFPPSTFAVIRMEGTGEKVFIERSSVIRVSEDDLARQPFDDTKSHVKEGSDRDHRAGESNGRKSSKRGRSHSRSRSRSRSCSSNRWVAKRRGANAFLLEFYKNIH